MLRSFLAVLSLATSSDVSLQEEEQLMLALKKMRHTEDPEEYCTNLVVELYNGILCREPPVTSEWASNNWYTKQCIEDANDDTATKPWDRDRITFSLRRSEEYGECGKCKNSCTVGPPPTPDGALYAIAGTEGGACPDGYVQVQDDEECYELATRYLDKGIPSSLVENLHFELQTNVPHCQLMPGSDTGSTNTFHANDLLFNINGTDDAVHGYRVCKKQLWESDSTDCPNRYESTGLNDAGVALCEPKERLCNTREWSDVKLRCGDWYENAEFEDGWQSELTSPSNECKVLVKDFGTKFRWSCQNYCDAQGLACVQGWEDEVDNCKDPVPSGKKQGQNLQQFSCSDKFYGTSDAICQCASP